MRENNFIWAADSFSDVVRRAREAKGLKQKDLAKMCEGVSPMYISQIENKDKGSIPSPRICLALAKALEIDPRRLLRLAYRANAPRDVQKLFTDDDQMFSAGKASTDPFLSLAHIAIDTVSEDKKEQVRKAWEDILKLALTGGAK